MRAQIVINGSLVTDNYLADYRKRFDALAKASFRKVFKQAFWSIPPFKNKISSLSEMRKPLEPLMSAQAMEWGISAIDELPEDLSKDQLEEWVAHFESKVDQIRNIENSGIQKLFWYGVSGIILGAVTFTAIVSGLLFLLILLA